MFVISQVGENINFDNWQFISVGCFGSLFFFWLKDQTKPDFAFDELDLKRWLDKECYFLH